MGCFARDGLPKCQSPQTAQRYMPMALSCDLLDLLRALAAWSKLMADLPVGQGMASPLRNPVGLATLWRAHQHLVVLPCGQRSRPAHLLPSKLPAGQRGGVLLCGLQL